MTQRRGRPVARLNLSPSSHLLLFDIEPRGEPPPFRSSNTALSSRFSTWSGDPPASGPLAGGSYGPLVSVMRAASPRWPLTAILAPRASQLSGSLPFDQCSTVDGVTPASSAAWLDEKPSERASSASSIFSLS